MSEVVLAKSLHAMYKQKELFKNKVTKTAQPQNSENPILIDLSELQESQFHDHLDELFSPQPSCDSFFIVILKFRKLSFFLRFPYLRISLKKSLNFQHIPENFYNREFAM